MAETQAFVGHALDDKQDRGEDPPQHWSRWAEQMKDLPNMWSCFELEARISVG